jgi:O-methyltransferase
MTSHEKLYALILAVRHVVDYGIDGTCVEYGVWRGASMQAVALTLSVWAGPTDSCTV